MKVVERIARKHIETQISDPDLRERVTPDYTIGCKRILPSNHWYRALDQPNVELVTEPIEAVRESAVVTADGAERAVDAIVFGTGFHVTDMPVVRLVRGRGGGTLDDYWRGSAHAYMGTSVPGFPNFFLLLGPNTGLGHSSMVYMIESQVEHVLSAVEALGREGADTIEVRADVEERFNRDVDARMQGTVWNSGCASWYIDASGRNSTLWPDWTWRFRRRAARFDPAAYELQRLPVRAAAVAAA
jgi:cation diffusion facilitator CzcD-associated flavoprotein CzcO